MKKAKKLLVTLLVLTFVLSTMTVGFASPLTDNIEDKDVAKAVARLEAFGIVNGMEDGQYHPELKVTREQFAKLLVEALGLGSAANAAKGPTLFKDVTADRWSSGYINVAAGQGLIKGMGNGLFAPDAEVTYAQALTMLVRALGYKDEFLSGSWPGNFIAKAADLDITDNVTFSPSGTADRGSVAVLVNNTLDAKVIEVGSYEDDTITYHESDKTLLEEKLNIRTFKNLRLVQNRRLNDSLEEDEIRFIATEDETTFGSDEFQEGQQVNAVIAKDLDTESLMGLKTKVYVNNDDEVIYMERDGNETVVTDAITKVTAEADGDIKEVELYKLDDAYALNDSDLMVYVTGAADDINNYDKNDLDVLDEDLNAGMFGRIVIQNDEIVFADLFAAADANGLVVTKVDTENKEITGILGTDDNAVVDLEDDYDNYLVLSADRKPMELEDIKEDNVIYVAKQNIDGDDYAVITVVADNVVTGELTKTKADKVEIDGTYYDLVKNNVDKDVDGEDYQLVSTFSVNNNDDIYFYNDSTKGYAGSDEVLKDAYEQQVTAIKDVVGRVLHLVADSEETSDSLYGVVTKAYADGDRIKIFVASEAKEVTYTFEDEDNSSGLDEGDFVEFKLNKDGEIAEDKITEADYANDYYKVDTEFGKNTIKTASGVGGGARTLAVSDSTVFINAPNLDNSANTAYEELTTGTYDPDDLEVVKWDDIKEDSVGSDGQFVAFINDDKDEVKAVLFIGAGIGSATADEEAVYVIDTWYQGGDEVAKVEFYDGETQEIVVDSSYESAIKAEMVAVVKLQSDGELQYITTSQDGFSYVSGVVYEKDGSYIKLFTDSNNNGEYDSGETISTAYRVVSDAVIYKEDDAKSLYNISKGASLDMVVESGKNAVVVKIK